MPPKIIKPRSKTAIARSPSKGKNLRARGKQIKVPVQPEEEEKNEPLPPPTPPKPVSWVDSIKPIIKPDAELHKELSKKRREAEIIKHTGICGEELTAIFNFAMFTATCDDKKEIRRERIKFREGKYIKPKTDGKRKLSRIKPHTTKSQVFSPPSVADRYAVPYEVGEKELLSSLGFGKYSANDEVDRLLEICDESNQKYTEHVEEHSITNFPYIISIIGPQCSGKTSLAQHIASLLNVRILKVQPDTVPKNENVKGVTVISNADEKQVIPQIVDFISKLDDGQGLILINCPTTKGQANQFEKAIAGAKISTLGGLIRIEAEQQLLEEFANQRIIDKNSGRIFNRNFFPPCLISSEFDESTDIIDYPSEKDAAYTKLSSAAQATEKGVKKVAPVLTISNSTFISDVLEKVYPFLVDIDKTNTPKIEDFPTVRFDSLQSVLSTKFKSDLFIHYKSKLMPLYGMDLGEMYSQLNSVRKVVDNIKEIAHDRFVLSINVHDEGTSMSKRFSANKANQYNYFNDVWDMANAARDKNIAKASHIINSVGFNTISGVDEDSLKKIFRGIIMHFIVTFNFLNSYKFNITHDSEEPTKIVNFETSFFDPLNLVEVCSLIYIDPFNRGIIAPPFCVKKEINKKKRVTLGDINNKRSKFFTPSKPPRNKSKKTSPKITIPKTSSTPVNLTTANRSLSEDSSELTSTTPTPVNSAPYSPLSSKIMNSEDNFVSSPIIDLRNKDMRRARSAISASANIIHECRSTDKYNIEFGEMLDATDKEKFIKDVREFLHFAKDHHPIIEMREEVDVMIRLFEYFVNIDEQINSLITVGKAELEDHFKKMAIRKHCNEMEHFSEKLLAMVDKKGSGRPVFEFDTSDITGHLADLMNKAGGVPNPDYPRYLNKSKLNDLLNSVDKSKRYLNIDELNETADKAGFDEHEKSELELIVRMTTNPNFIEAEPLCQIICEIPKEEENDLVPYIRPRPSTSLH